MVKYRLQTLTLVDRDAVAIGGGAPFASAVSDGDAISGSTVDRASGKRRVKNNVEAWR